MLLNLLITAAALLLLLAAAVWFTVHLHPLFPAGWLWAFVEFFCGLSLLVLAGGLTLVIYVFLQGALYYDSLLFGSDYLDYPLALRGLRRHEKQEFLKRRRPYVLGRGTTVFLASLLPFVGAVLLAVAVVGAVLLHRRLQ